MKIAAKPVMSVKSLKSMMSLIPPAMHSLVRSANAPTKRPARSESATGACIEPGPDSENRKSAGNAMKRTNKNTFRSGNAAPSSALWFLFLPRVKPFERK